MGNSSIENAKVRISEDGMEAYLSLPLPASEQKYTLTEILEFVRSQKVTAGIDERAVRRMIETPIYGYETLIARGKKPVDGKDGVMTYHFNPEKNTKPTLREDGSVDYWSIHAIEMVNAGQVIADYQEPTEAIDGMNVSGRPVPAKRGRPIPPLTGKGFSCSDDGHYYTADVTGKIELVNGRIRISDVYEIQGDVGLETGNIDFRGDVVIHGNVAPGASVKATGSITVDGICENCTLCADKDIILRGGVLGGNKTLIRTKGCIHAKFFEYCTVEAEGSIEAASALDCRIQCFDRLYLAGKKASIVGGFAYATSGMEIGILGSQSEVKTEIQVGVSMEIMKERSDAMVRLKAAEEIVRKISDGLKQYETIARERGIDISEDERRTVLLRTRMTKQAEVMTLQKTLERLNGIMERAKGANISVIQVVYPGIKVRVDEFALTVKESQNSVRFVKRQDHVVMLSLADEVV